jgi:hypothetical protein
MAANERQEAAKVSKNSEAVKKHYAEKCDAFKIRPHKDEGQQIREFATAHNMSVQGLFLVAVREYMAAHNEAPKSED